MTSVRCAGCREWFEKRESDCPYCGTVRPGFNKWLRTAQLNNNLYSALEMKPTQVSKAAREAAETLV